MPNHAAAERSLANPIPRVPALSGATSVPAARGVFHALGAIMLGSALLVAPTAGALEGIDLSKGVEPPAEGQCGVLTRIKYPWMVCDGSTRPENATWENSRRMPRQGDWTEGDGAWGPSLNEK